MNTIFVNGNIAAKQPSFWQKHLSKMIIVLALLLIFAAIYYLVANKEPSKKIMPTQVVQLKIIVPPPPPPPPPPPKEEPVKVKEQVQQPTPEPVQAPMPKSEAPPTPQLAADSEGAGDLSGKAGGTPYTGDGAIGGSGGGNGTGTKGSYRGALAGEFREKLRANKHRLRSSVPIKPVAVRVAVAADGVIEKVDLLESTGRSEMDRIILEVLREINKASNPPPDGQAKSYSWRISFDD